MSRDVPYDPELECDMCGSKGAFDFYGDFLCPDCHYWDEEEDNAG